MTIEPLIPPEVDLRDFDYMPLKVKQLRDSALASLASGDEFRAAVLLWCSSWHEVPAASLPNDDRLLASLAGYGRDVKGWLKVKEMALRGFEVCSDGRFYHPVIADLAVDAWSKRRKIADTMRNVTAARIRKRAEQRHVNGADNDTLHDTTTKGERKGIGEGLVGELTLSNTRDELEIAKSLWNEAASEMGFASVAMLTEPRKKALAARLGELGGIDGWRIMLEIIGKSPHLLGENDRGWKVFFDWLLKPANLTKVMENTYVRAPKLSNWDIAGAVLSEQDRLEGLREKGGTDDLHALPEPESRS